jgi:hypothetical protein
MNIEEVARTLVPKALEVFPYRVIIAVAIMHEGCLEIKAWDINPDKKFLGSVRGNTQHYSEKLRKTACLLAMRQLGPSPHNSQPLDLLSYLLDENTAVTFLSSEGNFDLQRGFVAKMKE